MKFKKNDNAINKGYDVIKDGKVIGTVYKTILIDLTELWKNNKSDDFFSTRREASENLLDA